MYTNTQLTLIFTKTNGKCHLCYRALTFNSYGDFSSSGCWEVDHSLPKAQGGTDHMNNLYAACISCNRSKQDGSSKDVRSNNGFNRPPRSQSNYQSRKKGNQVAGGIIGGAIGALLGPIGAGIGSALGAWIACSATED
jgi:hypothetical protein